jgi:hypothetical protein
MATQTLMSYPQVHTLATTFNVTGDVLDAIEKALDVAIAALHAAAFFTFGGSELLAQWLEGIKPHVQKLAKMSHHIHDAVESAIKFVQTGDSDGVNDFH